MTTFDRYAPAMALFFASFGISVPALFGAVVIQGGSPVTPQQYGEMVYAVPAIVWASAQMVSGGAAAIAIACNRPKIAALFGTGFVALMLFFAAAAIVAGPTGTLVVAGVGAGVVPCALPAVLICWRGRHGE